MMGSSGQRSPPSVDEFKIEGESLDLVAGRTRLKLSSERDTSHFRDTNGRTNERTHVGPPAQRETVKPSNDLHG